MTERHRRAEAENGAFVRTNDVTNGHSTGFPHIKEGEGKKERKEGPFGERKLGDDNRLRLFTVFIATRIRADGELYCSHRATMISFIDCWTSMSFFLFAPFFLVSNRE